MPYLREWEESIWESLLILKLKLKGVLFPYFWSKINCVKQIIVYLVVEVILKFVFVITLRMSRL